jgi:apolipoprotein D and lipocalin family protein
VYNTYVLDTNYDEWLLLLHCAEKKLTPRYLSSIIMSRSSKPLKPAVLSYLRDKLARYNVPLEYVFPVRQDNCNKTTSRRMGLNFVRSLGAKRVLKP